MRIVVTGATGFIGRHVVPRLHARGHQVLTVARDESTVPLLGWPKDIRFLAADIYAAPEAVLAEVRQSDALMHLVWPGLPNYASSFHLDRNLPGDIEFLRAVVVGGCRQVLVTGTCFEYGIQWGPLSEDCPTRPVNPYGMAKDALRRELESMRRSRPFCLQWARLFYMYGPGQNPNSLLAQLDRAIDEGAGEFSMSGGEQLRDYLPVEEVAARLVRLLEHPEFDGVTNICSGNPISVRRLVEERMVERGVTLRLRLGAYPYSEHESMAFWGSSNRDLR